MKNNFTLLFNPEVKKTFFFLALNLEAYTKTTIIPPKNIKIMATKIQFNLIQDKTNLPAIENKTRVSANKSVLSVKKIVILIKIINLKNISNIV